MFVKVSDTRIVPISSIVDIRISPATEERAEWIDESFEDGGRKDTVPARPISVEIVTTAQESRHDDGGDHPEFRHTDFHPYTIRLVGEEAELSLAALPVYVLVREEA